MMSYQVEVCDDGVEEEEDVVPAEKIGNCPASFGSGVDQNPGHVDGARVQGVNELTSHQTFVFTSSMTE